MANLEMIHLDPVELLDYFDGTLNEERVRQHLDACQRCRSKLKNLALTKIMISPPSAALSKDHIPPETLAEYEEDKLRVEQNRAVEEHFTQCRRCLIDYVSLKLAMKESHEDEPSDGLIREILDNLDNFRRVKSLGTVFVKPIRDAMSLDFKPVPEPDYLGHYSEDAAAYLYSFQPEPERMMRLEQETLADFDPATEVLSAPEQPVEYEVGELIHRQRVVEPVSKSVTTDNNLVSISVTKEDDHNALVVEILDRDGSTPLPDIQVVLDPLTDSPVSRQTDQLGTARFVLPHGPSLLKIYLEKVYEIEVKSLV